MKVGKLSVDPSTVNNMVLLKEFWYSGSYWFYFTPPKPCSNLPVSAVTLRERYFSTYLSLWLLNLTSTLPSNSLWSSQHFNDFKEIFCNVISRSESYKVGSDHLFHHLQKKKVLHWIFILIYIFNIDYVYISIIHYIHINLDLFIFLFFIKIYPSLYW